MRQVETDAGGDEKLTFKFVWPNNIVIKYAGNNADLKVEITTIDYPPGDYFVTFNLTDIYGQTFQARAPLSLGRMFILF